MSSKTFSPLDVESDFFLSNLDYLNTGGRGGDVDLITSYGVPDSADNVVGALNQRSGRPANAVGQYAAIPGATPKYARHRAERPRENYDTLARMFIRARNPDAIRKRLKNSVSKDVAGVMLGDRAGKSNSLGYVDFFLDSIQRAHAEKVQVTDVLEDNFVAFFFGSAPVTYTFGGHLMNTVQDDWAVQMLEAYEDLFRGTALARFGVQLYIRFDSYIVSGACLSMSMISSAANETVVPFNFQFLVHRKHLLYGNAYGSTKLPKGAGTFVPEGVNLREPRPKQLKVFFAKPAQSTGDGINEDAPRSEMPESQGAIDKEMEEMYAKSASDRAAELELRTGQTQMPEDTSEENQRRVDAEARASYRLAEARQKAAAFDSPYKMNW